MKLLNRGGETMKKLIIMLVSLLVLAGCANTPNIEEDNNEESIFQTETIPFFQELQYQFELSGENSVAFEALFAQKKPSEIIRETNSDTMYFKYQDEYYRTYPYIDEIYFKNIQTGEIYHIDDPKVVVDMYNLMPTIFKETIESEETDVVTTKKDVVVDIDAYDANILTPITLEEDFVK